MLMFLVN